MNNVVGGSGPRGGDGKGVAELLQHRTQPPRVVTPTPVAMSSSALHAARLHFGKNAIVLSPLRVLDFLRFPVVSPTMAIIVAGVLFTGLGSGYIGDVVTLIFVLVVQSVVLARTAVACRGWVATWQRCFPRSSAVVCREGTWALLDSTELVPGDLIQLGQGSMVPADCTLYRGCLLLDLSPLTGRTELMSAEPGHLLKAGTAVADGSGSATVRYTSAETFAGQPLRLLRHLARGFTRPLVQRAYVLVCFVILVVIVTAEIVLFGLFSGWSGCYGFEVARQMLLYALACLPLNLDLALLEAATCGAATAMQRGQAVVLRLGALLSLASVDVLVVDKSGTLTTGLYCVAEAFCSFSPDYATRDSLVQLMALATKWREPCLHAMRRAVLRCADLDRCDAYTRLAYVEHEGEHRTSTVLRSSDGTLLRVTEGRVESVLSLLTSPPSHALAVEVARLAATWGAQGLRTRAVAVGVETGPWVLAGLVTFADTVRDDAAALVQECAKRGVSVTIASGDAAPVVATVAATVFSTGSLPQVMTGRDLPILDAWQTMDASSLPSATSSLLANAEGSTVDDVAAYAACHVYAEMQPEHKVTLVRLLQRTGLRVGVLGDGVNDAAAAWVADVGLALVSPERGPPFPSQGALWGADVALPSTQLTTVCELIDASRAVFATAHYLLFHAFTAALQAAAIFLLAVLFAPATSSSTPYSCSHATSSLRPSKLSLLVYTSLTIIGRLFQARQQGDVAFWSKAPCQPNVKVAATQAACIALIGLAASVPVVMTLPPYTWLLRLVGEGFRASKHGGSVMLYTFNLQLGLTLICASPVRCGLPFLSSRALQMVVFAALLLLMDVFVVGFYSPTQLVLLPYCIAVAVLQDAAKMAVHGVCYRFNCFAYRGTADHMAGRRRRGHRDGDTGDGMGNDGDDADAVDVYGVEGTVASAEEAEAARRASRPSTAGLNGVLGCLVPLELPLATAAPPGHSAAPDEE